MQTPPLECTTNPPVIAPCEHIAGNERFILKAFELQDRHRSANGRSLVDVTLDLEDGAPVGQEEPLRQLFASLITSPHNSLKQAGVRVHPPSSEHCCRDLEVLLNAAADTISYITIPKAQSVRDIVWCAGLIRYYSRSKAPHRTIPLHILIETIEALEVVEEIARLPEVEVLDFGLMDFISQLGGTVPATCMRSPGQFTHEILRAAKTRIVMAALSAHKVASHNVTVDIREPTRVLHDAESARKEFGFLRMWSIHPDQIQPIIQAMTPSSEEIAEARDIIAAAQSANWGPIEHNGRLHDRASYRYYYGIIARSGS